MAIGRRQFIRRTAAGIGLGAMSKADAASPAFGESFAFAVVADPHASETPKPGIERYGNGVEKFLACIRAMERLAGEESVDFALVVGDIHPCVLEEPLKNVSIPLHAVAGNHESDAAKRKQLRDLFPGDFKRGGNESDYYSFVHKGVRFIGVCDAGHGGEHVGHFCSESITPRGQCEWLEGLLKSRGMPNIVFAHIPPERDGKDRNMFMSRNDSRWFNALVREAGPAAMFFGHLHQPTEEYLLGSTRCFNVRSCCWNFGNAPLGFLIVRVTPDGIVVREIETGTYATDQ